VRGVAAGAIVRGSILVALGDAVGYVLAVFAPDAAYPGLLRYLGGYAGEGQLARAPIATPMGVVVFVAGELQPMLQHVDWSALTTLPEEPEVR
jgi:hypothetical protein